MTTKTSGKAIVGIALTVIMVASVMAATVGGAGADTPAGRRYNEIVKSTDVQTVLIGQDIRFAGVWTEAPVISRLVSGDLENTYKATESGGTYYVYNVNWPTTGAFYVNYVKGTPDTFDAQLSVEEPKMPLKLKVKDKEVSSIARSTKLNIDVGGINLGDADVVDLVIIGPNGQITEKNGQRFKAITVAALKDMNGDNAIDTSSWDIGHYTFQVKTKPEKACNLEDQSVKKELGIVKGIVQITADTTEVPELERVKLTVTGIAGHQIRVAPDPISKNAYFPASIDDNPNMTTNWFSDTIDDDGTRTYAVEFNDSGTYTIKVIDYNEIDMYDTVDITVTKKQVTFDVPASVELGGNFTIRGTANTGDTVDIAVDDHVCAKLNDLVLDEKDIEIAVIEKNVTFDVPSMVIMGETLTIKGTSKCGDTVTIAVADQIVQKLDQIVIDENNEFAVEIDTTAVDAPAEFKIPGAVSLRAFIDRAETGDISPDEIDDGSTEVFMVRPWLTAGVSTDSVDLGDEFTVSGTAKGTKSVDILIVGPKGYGGSNIESGIGLYKATVGVSASEGTYSRKISVGDDVDNGRYHVVALSPGSDGVYGCDSGGMMGAAQSKYSVASPTPTPMPTPMPTPTPIRIGNCRGGVTIEEALDCYTLNGRTQYEMLEIFDNIVGLCDDLIWVSYITVGKQETLILNPIADVRVSEPLEVTGETSREDGAIIWVTVAKPYYMIIPKAAISKDNTFNATFDTTGAQLGSYVVTAMDGYGYTAARIVNVIAETAAQTSLYSDAVGSYLGVTNAQEDTITIQKMYIYACPGTGGHSEYAAFYDLNGTKLGEGRWNGYQVADCQYITFDAPFTLEIGKTYNYTIKTGSYPQIIHKQSHTTDNGTITCTEFTDANGNTCNDWIPAIRLE